MSWLSFLGLVFLIVAYILSDDTQEMFSMIGELLVFMLVAIGIVLLWGRLA